MFHQLGSIGSGTGVLMGVTAATLCCLANQLVGDHIDCFFQLGPTVQPGRAPAASNANVSRVKSRRGARRVSGRLLRKVRLHI